VHTQAREVQRAEQARMAMLDAQESTLSETTTILVTASLLTAGYHQHKRQWRKRRQQDNPQEGECIDMTRAPLTETISFEGLAEIVHRAQQGDASTVPLLRQLLTEVPALWHRASTLATHAERAWGRTISGDTDLVAQEVFQRQLDALAAELVSPDATPLERLLARRVALDWAILYHAELRASGRLQQSVVLSHAEENRLDKVQKRFLASWRELARAQKLLPPQTKLTVNVAQNQIVA
jgi:hypothetical protein